jgi:hypothetical protein
VAPGGQGAAIAWTTQSQRVDFEAALGRSSSPRDPIDRMMSIHRDRANPDTLWVAAYDLLGKTPA